MHTADRDNEFGFSRCPEIRCSTQRLKPICLDLDYDMAEAIS